MPMPAVQIAYALSRLVTAAAQLQTQLTASGGKPTDEIIATIGAEVLSWLRIESADIAPVAHVGIDLLTRPTRLAKGAFVAHRITTREPIPRMTTPPRAPTPEIRFERVLDVANRLSPADCCPICGVPSPLLTPLRASFGRGLSGGWSTVPSHTYNALHTSPQLLREPIQPCSHWCGTATTPDEVRALLPQGGVARARHATTADGRPRRDGADTRWRCWRSNDGHVAQ